MKKIFFAPLLGVIIFIFTYNFFVKSGIPLAKEAIVDSLCVQK
jgi:hypothetical protein